MNLRERLTKRRVLSESQLEGTPLTILGKGMDRLGDFIYDIKELVLEYTEKLKEDHKRIKKTRDY